MADALDRSMTKWSPDGHWILYRAGESLDLIAPDGKSTRQLSLRPLMVYGYSRDGREVYGILHNVKSAGPEWQLYDLNVRTGVERFLSSVDFPPSTATLAGFSLSPDGKHALTSAAEWPFALWMLEGFQHPGPKNWLAMLMQH